MAGAGQAKYRPYPAYKPSGVEWLGDIPEEWDTTRLKSLFDERREKVSDKDFSALSVTMQGIVPQLENAAKTDDGDNRKLVRKGDFVINSRSDRKGSSGVSNLDGSVSLISTVLCPKGIAPAFVHHLFKSYNFQEEFYRFGKGIVADLWSTNFASMKNITVPVVPLTEQTKIAAFLDHETGKINGLIAKQQRLIALLEEKRQAVVSHAVIKGLDKSAPLRPSGIDWLGDVPAHWEVAKVKYYSRMSGGYAFDSGSFKDTGIQLLRIGNLYLNSLSLERQPIFLDKNLLSALPNFCVFRGDILMSLTGTLGKTDYGFAIIVDQDGPFLLNQRVAKLVPYNNKITGEYLLYSLRSDTYLFQLYSLPSGTKQANLSYSDVLNIEIAVPPIDEQRQITDYVIKRAAIFEVAISKAQSAVTLLKERRTALISAAVTGKIDLRDWQVPDATTAYSKQDITQNEEALA